MDAKKQPRTNAKKLVPSPAIKKPKKAPLPTGSSHPTVVGAIAEGMAEAEMLRHGIMPFRPLIDIGVDRVTCCGPILKRVQIKGQQVASRRRNGSLRFETVRGRKVSGRTTPSKGYAPDELEAFIFVHTELQLFYIVPADRISSDRRSITFGPNSHSQWLNAWWVLKQE